VLPVELGREKRRLLTESLEDGRSLLGAGVFEAAGGAVR